jgi:HPt (histidine-containing phosphotransfer) domain-containing protein
VVPAGNPDIIDLAILSRSVAGDSRKVRRYAELFVTSMPETAAEFEQALARGDMPALADLGHRLKSSCRMVGALGLAAICQSLEACRHEGSSAQAAALVGQLSLLFNAVAADIATMLA